MSMGRGHASNNLWYSARGMARMIKFINTNKLYIKSKRVKSAREIDELGYDCIILGSDEVFNITHPAFDPIYYGVGLTTKCITYAPSAGQCPSDFNMDASIIQSLEKLYRIAVRDTHTQCLIKSNSDQKVDLVVDPTFLYDFSKEENFVG